MNRIQVELALGPATGWKDAYARPERNRDLVSAPPDVIPPAAKGCLQNVIVDLRDVDPGRMQEVAAGIVYRVAGVEVRGGSLLDCPEMLRALEIDPSWTWVDISIGGERIIRSLSTGWRTLPRRLGVSVRSAALDSVRTWSRVADSVKLPLRFVWEPNGGPAGTIETLTSLGRLALARPPAVLGVAPGAAPDTETDRLVSLVCQALRELGLRRMGVHLVSCPACARTKVNLRRIAAQVWEAIEGIDADLCVAVMGCEVNGPGEARMADVGVACGKGIGLIFREGKVLRRVPEAEIAAAVQEEVRNCLRDRSAGKEQRRP